MPLALGYRARWRPLLDGCSSLLFAIILLQNHIIPESNALYTPPLLNTIGRYLGYGQQNTNYHQTGNEAVRKVNLQHKKKGEEKFHGKGKKQKQRGPGGQTILGPTPSKTTSRMPKLTSSGASAVVKQLHSNASKMVTNNKKLIYGLTRGVSKKLQGYAGTVMNYDADVMKKYYASTAAATTSNPEHATAEVQIPFEHAPLSNNNDDHRDKKIGQIVAEEGKNHGKIVEEHGRKQNHHYHRTNEHKLAILNENGDEIDDTGTENIAGDQMEAAHHVNISSDAKKDGKGKPHPNRNGNGEEAGSDEEEEEEFFSTETDFNEEEVVTSSNTDSIHHLLGEKVENNVAGTVVGASGSNHRHGQGEDGGAAVEKPSQIVSHHPHHHVDGNVVITKAGDNDVQGYGSQHPLHPHNQDQVHEGEHEVNVEEGSSYSTDGTTTHPNEGGRSGDVVEGTMENTTIHGKEHHDIETGTATVDEADNGLAKVSVLPKTPGKTPSVDDVLDGKNTEKTMEVGKHSGKKDDANINNMGKIEERVAAGEQHTKDEMEPTIPAVGGAGGAVDEEKQETVKVAESVNKSTSAAETKQKKNDGTKEEEQQMANGKTPEQLTTMQTLTIADALQRKDSKEGDEQLQQQRVITITSVSEHVQNYQKLEELMKFGAKVVRIHAEPFLENSFSRPNSIWSHYAFTPALAMKELWPLVPLLFKIRGAFGKAKLKQVEKKKENEAKTLINDVKFRINVELSLQRLFKAISSKGMNFDRLNGFFSKLKNKKEWTELRAEISVEHLAHMDEDKWLTTEKYKEKNPKQQHVDIPFNDYKSITDEAAIREYTLADQFFWFLVCLEEEGGKDYLGKLITDFFAEEAMNKIVAIQQGIKKAQESLPIFEEKEKMLLQRVFELSLHMINLLFWKVGERKQFNSLNLNKLPEYLRLKNANVEAPYNSYELSLLVIEMVNRGNTGDFADLGPMLDKIADKFMQCEKVYKDKEMQRDLEIVEELKKKYGHDANVMQALGQMQSEVDAMNRAEFYHWLGFPVVNEEQNQARAGGFAALANAFKLLSKADQKFKKEKFKKDFMDAMDAVNRQMAKDKWEKPAAGLDSLLSFNRLGDALASLDEKAERREVELQEAERQEAERQKAERRQEVERWKAERLQQQKALQAASNNGVESAASSNKGGGPMPPGPPPPPLPKRPSPLNGRKTIGGAPMPPPPPAPMGRPSDVKKPTAANPLAPSPQSVAAALPDTLSQREMVEKVVMPPPPPPPPPLPPNSHQTIHKEAAHTNRSLHHHHPPHTSSQMSDQHHHHHPAAANGVGGGNHRQTQGESNSGVVASEKSSQTAGNHHQNGHDGVNLAADAKADNHDNDDDVLEHRHPPHPHQQKDGLRISRVGGVNEVNILSSSPLDGKHPNGGGEGVEGSIGNNTINGNQQQHDTGTRTAVDEGQMIGQNGGHGGGATNVVVAPSTVDQQQQPAAAALSASSHPNPSLENNAKTLVSSSGDDGNKHNNQSQAKPPPKASPPARSVLEKSPSPPTPMERLVNHAFKVRRVISSSSFSAED